MFVSDCGSRAAVSHPACADAFPRLRSPTRVIGGSPEARSYFYARYTADRVPLKFSRLTVPNVTQLACEKRIDGGDSITMVVSCRSTVDVVLLSALALITFSRRFRINEN